MEKNIDLNLTYASSIENVDIAFFEWVDTDLDLHCDTKNGFEKIKTLWVTPERSFQVKNNKELRDINGTLNLPIITVERTSISQDQKDSATYYNSYPPLDNRHWIAKRINQKKTSEFANMQNQKKYGSINFVSPVKNEKIVYKYSHMLLPVYATFTYVISVFTQFQHQMNQAIQPILTKSGSQRYFIISRNGYKYECFIDQNIDVKNNINSLEEEERRYVSNISVKVIAALVTAGDNEKNILVKEYENAVEVKLSKDDKMVNLNNLKGTKIGTEKTTGIFLNSETSKKISYIIGDGVNSVFNIIHNLYKKDVIVIVKENFGNYNVISPEIQVFSENEIIISLKEAPKVNAYFVTIIG